MFGRHNALGKVVLAFIIVALSAQWWPKLPSITLLMAVCAIAILLIMSFSSHGHTAYIVGALLGLLLMASVGHRYHSWQLPSDKIKKTVIVEGEILEVKQSNNVQTILLGISRLDNDNVHFSAKINAYHLNKGYQNHQQVRLCIRLKPAHGLQNPGGFDYWRWLVSRNIKATGYIKKCVHNQLLVPDLSLSAKIKYRLGLANSSAEKWLLAMLLADRSKLNRQDWQLLQSTGVAHLFTLSGLHMGMVFLVCLWLAKGIVFIFMRPLLKRAEDWPSICIHLLSLAMSWGFVALCDFPIPLVRAALAITLYSFVLLSNSMLSFSQGALLVLSICLCCFPLSIYGLSLYLSFSAVFAILFWNWRYQFTRRTLLQGIKQAVSLQLGLSVFMALASSSAFGQIHWSSFFINLLAIPFVTLFVVPIACITLLLLLIVPAVGYSAAQGLGEILQSFITVLAALPTLSSELNLPWFIGLVLAIALGLILIPSLDKRFVFCILCVSALSLLALHVKSPSSESWKLHVFDVGQGSALLIESDGEAMLVDTGGGFSQHNTLAQSIIAPSLEKLSIDPPLLGVITHFDSDHAAGFRWLSNNRYITKWISIDNHCVTGESWSLGKLSVEVLWPDKSEVALSTASKNNLSCVLKVTDGFHSLLITGDIEKQTEAALLRRDVDLSADIVIVPHHGSNSSSTMSFIKAVSPRYAVISSGFYNRWGFPHQAVLERYQKVNAAVMTTAEYGYMRFLISPKQTKLKHIQVKTQSLDLQARWYKSR